MGQDQFTEFVSKLSQDAALQAAMSERFGDPSGGVPADELIAFAGDHGYDFSVEEAEGELSDAALEGVTGGASTLFPKVEAPTLNNFEEVKVTYLSTQRVFTFDKVSW